MGLCSFHLAKKYFKGAAKLTTMAFKKGEPTLATLDRMKMARQQDRPHPRGKFDILRHNEVLIHDFLARHSDFFSDEVSLLTLQHICRMHGVRRYATYEWQCAWNACQPPFRPQINWHDRRVCHSLIEEAVCTMYIYDLLVLIAWFLRKITRTDLDRFKNVPETEWPDNILRDEIDSEAWWNYHDQMVHKYEALYAQREDEEAKECQTAPTEAKECKSAPTEAKKSKKSQQKKARKQRIRFIPNYWVYFKRTVLSHSNQSRRQHVLPAFFAPVSYLQWLMRSVLTLDKGTIQRREDDIRAMRFLNVVHQQGQWLSHMAFYSSELYVISAIFHDNNTIMPLGWW